MQASGGVGTPQVPTAMLILSFSPSLILRENRQCESSKCLGEEPFPLIPEDRSRNTVQSSHFYSSCAEASTETSINRYCGLLLAKNSRPLFYLSDYTDM